ncbi:hypothetical protein [Stutzerimonas stutzeri]|uniref:hypothetical protein n=1 Tax=Stutzerimonas stutzeri TaxID=316 RepID=UPI001BCCBB56|nr:hypothetical protein [Stutzerimonas stutzeri]
MKALEKRLHDFIMHSNIGAEDADNLDSIFKKEDGTQHSRPDYFLRGRSVILEKKTITKDPTNDFNSWLNKLTEDDPWLAANWLTPMPVEQIIQAHPDKIKFRSKICDRLYRGLRNDIMQKASKQLLETQRLLGLDRAVKGLLLLNEKVEVFEEQILINEIEKNLSRIKINSEPECKGIDFVLLISETKADTKHNRYPCNLIISAHAYNKPIIPFHMRDFIIKWSNFNERPLIETK